MHCVVSESSAWSTTWARWELWCPSVSGGTRPVLSSRAVSMGFEDDWNEDNNDNMHSDERSTAILVWYDVVLYMYLAHMWFFWYFSLHVTIKWHEEHEYLVEMLKGVRVKHTCNILPWKNRILNPLLCWLPICWSLPKQRFAIISTAASLFWTLVLLCLVTWCASLSYCVGEFRSVELISWPSNTWEGRTKECFVNALFFESLWK